MSKPAQETPQPRRAPGPRTAVAAAEPRAGGRRTQVRRSGIHGKGLFALQPIAKGEIVIEYKGDIISWPEAQRRHPHDPEQPNHTFYFHIDDGHVIDGGSNGNSARWINHSCSPNCKAEETGDGRVFVRALRALKPGDEIFYDYALMIDARKTARLKKDYECRCGSRRCRGTMLAP